MTACLRVTALAAGSLMIGCIHIRIAAVRMAFRRLVTARSARFVVIAVCVLRITPTAVLCRCRITAACTAVRVVRGILYPGTVLVPFLCRCIGTHAAGEGVTVRILGVGFGVACFFKIGTAKHIAAAGMFGLRL